MSNGQAVLRSCHAVRSPGDQDAAIDPLDQRARAVVFAPLDGAGPCRTRRAAADRRDRARACSPTASACRARPRWRKRFGVATVTAREALEALRDKGLVDTRRGRDGGSFVTARARQDPRGLDARVAVALAGRAARHGARTTRRSPGRCASSPRTARPTDDLEHLRGGRRHRSRTTSETAARRRGRRSGSRSPRSRSRRGWCARSCACRPNSPRCSGSGCASRSIVGASLDARTDVLDAIAARRWRRRPASAPIAHVGAAIDWLLDTKAGTRGESMSASPTAIDLTASTVVDTTFADVFRLIERVARPASRSTSATHDGRRRRASTISSRRWSSPDLSNATARSSSAPASSRSRDSSPTPPGTWPGGSATRTRSALARPARRCAGSRRPRTEHAESFRDYTTLEWWRVPSTHARPHITGPYVDYLCTDDYTLTLTMPVLHDGAMIGVVGADLYVNDIERALLPSVRSIGRAGDVVNASGRVVVVDRPHRPTGSVLRVDDLRERLAAAAPSRSTSGRAQHRRVRRHEPRFGARVAPGRGLPPIRCRLVRSDDRHERVGRVHRARHNRRGPGRPALGWQAMMAHFAEHPDEAALFSQAMVDKSAAVVPAVVEAYDFSTFATVVDVGGGTGRLLSAILEQNPATTGVLFELPHVIADAGAAASDRLRLVGGRLLRRPVACRRRLRADGGTPRLDR